MHAQLCINASRANGALSQGPITNWRQCRVWTVEAEFAPIDGASIAMTSVTAHTPYQSRHRGACQRNRTQIEKIRRNGPSPKNGQLAPWTFIP